MSRIRVNWLYIDIIIPSMLEFVDDDDHDSERRDGSIIKIPASHGIGFGLSFSIHVSSRAPSFFSSNHARGMLSRWRSTASARGGDKSKSGWRSQPIVDIVVVTIQSIRFRHRESLKCRDEQCLRRCNFHC